MPFFNYAGFAGAILLTVFWAMVYNLLFKAKYQQPTAVDALSSCSGIFVEDLMVFAQHYNFLCDSFFSHFLSLVFQLRHCHNALHGRLHTIGATIKENNIAFPAFCKIFDRFRPHAKKNDICI